MGVGGLTSEERIVALEEARKLRALRAAIRAEIAGGKRTAASVLDPQTWTSTNPDTHRALKGMRVRAFLTSLNGIGPKRAEQAIDDCNIDPKRKLGGLGPQQRARLLEWLQARNIA